MPDEYSIDLELTVFADSKIEAMEKVKNIFDNIADVEVSGKTETELFAELGIEWED